MTKQEIHKTKLENSGNTEDMPICEIDMFKTKLWKIHGQYHRLNGPAVEYDDGSCEWWVNGKRHRLNGPAIEFSGHKSWWINGKCVPEREVYERIEI